MGANPVDSQKSECIYYSALKLGYTKYIFKTIDNAHLNNISLRINCETIFAAFIINQHSSYTQGHKFLKK